MPLKNPAMVSSKQHNWETPDKFMDILPVHFDLDVCAEPSTAKADKYFTIEDDGLSQRWEGTCWMNPPYGRALPPWIRKAYMESRQPYNKQVWCLVPARTDTIWFQEAAKRGSVFFIKGRISFLMDGKVLDPALFPSALVIFDSTLRPEMKLFDPKKDLLFL